MRISRIIIALAGVLVFIAGMKLAAPLSPAQSDVLAPTLDVMQLQLAHAQALPAQPLHDMSFAID